MEEEETDIANVEEEMWRSVVIVDHGRCGKYQQSGPLPFFLSARGILHNK